jgi:CRP/FNR family transcriptional activator FtrB
VCTVFRIDGAFARATVTELAACFRASIKHAKDLKLRGALERLANYLLREAGARGPRFELPVSKARLASFLGMTPENLSRAFGTLGQYGVRVDGATITLTAPADLSRLARPNPLIDDPAS